jgi:hypothetical protein
MPVGEWIILSVRGEVEVADHLDRVSRLVEDFFGLFCYKQSSARKWIVVLELFVGSWVGTAFRSPDLLYIGCDHSEYCAFPSSQPSGSSAISCIDSVVRDYRSDLGGSPTYRSRFAATFRTVERATRVQCARTRFSRPC